LGDATFPHTTCSRFDDRSDHRHYRRRRLEQLLSSPIKLSRPDVFDDDVLIARKTMGALSTFDQPESPPQNRSVLQERNSSAPPARGNLQLRLTGNQPDPQNSLREDVG